MMMWHHTGEQRTTCVRSTLHILRKEIDQKYIQAQNTFLSSLALGCFPTLCAIDEAVMFPLGCLCACASSTLNLCASLGPSARLGPLIYRPQLA